MAKTVEILFCGLLLVIFSGWSDCTDVSIVLSSADENVTVRSTVLLVCVAYGGSTAPSIVWYRNGNPITNTTRYTVYSSTTRSSGLMFAESILEICSIGLEEGGEYICNATSSSGDSSTTNTTTLTVQERGEPDRPCNCSSIPVYSETGSLISIEFNWTKVANPPVVVAGVNPDITSYNVSVNGLGAHIVPAESVCAESSSMPCSYSYPVPGFNKAMTSALLDGKVAAVNEIGRGRTCSPSLRNIDQTNSYMTLSVDAVRGSVICRDPRSSGQNFRCDFCYASDGSNSCQDPNGPMKCNEVLDGTTWTLPTLSEGTYCYRATAVVNGIPVAVVQDTFSVRQQASGGVASLLAGSVAGSFIIAFLVGLMIGCLTCLCYYHGKAKYSQQRVCLNCTNGSGFGGHGGETKETGLYEDIPASMPIKEKDMSINTNEAYGKLPNMNQMW